MISVYIINVCQKIYLYFLQMTVQIHLILLLTIVLIIHIYSCDPASEMHAKIIAYAVFLSYYITSGNGKYVNRGLTGSLLTWFYLLFLEKNYSGEVLYWGKLMWYGLLWLYALMTYQPKTLIIPSLMTVFVLLLVTTEGPWKIEWHHIGSRNVIKDMFFVSGEKQAASYL